MAKRRRTPEQFIQDKQDKRIDIIYRSLAGTLNPLQLVGGERNIGGLFKTTRAAMTHNPSITDDDLREIVKEYVGTKDGAYPKHHVTDVAAELEREDRAPNSAS